MKKLFVVLVFGGLVLSGCSAGPNLDQGSNTGGSKVSALIAHDVGRDYTQQCFSPDGGKSVDFYFYSFAAPKYVILHYTINNSGQENVFMSDIFGVYKYYNIPNFNTNQAIHYSFTYNIGGLQYDTSWFYYNSNVICTNSVVINGTSADITFYRNPCPTGVICHYIVDNQNPQNAVMTLKDGSFHYSVPNASTANAMSYNFTFTFNGVQEDTQTECFIIHDVQAPSAPVINAFQYAVNGYVSLMWYPSFDNAKVSSYSLYDGNTLLKSGINGYGIMYTRLVATSGYMDAFGMQFLKNYNLNLRAVDTSGNISAPAFITNIYTSNQ